MNKIILSVFVSIIALALATFSTYAAWSDTVTVTNNQIQTGTADLNVSTDSGSTWNTATKQSSLVLSNLIPGGSNSNYTFSLWNASTSGLTFGLSAQISSVTGAALAEDQMEIAVYEQGLTAAEGSGWISLSDWQSSQHSIVSNINNGISEAKDYVIAARLLDTADDEWQGKTVSFTLTINGEQI